MSEDLTPNGVDVTKYSSLQHDFSFIHKNESLMRTLQGIEDLCQHAGDQYDQCPILALKQKIQLDILSLYTVNSMFWKHEESKGSPPEAMVDMKHNLGRFVRAALYDIDNKKEHEHGAPLKKKKRREM